MSRSIEYKIAEGAVKIRSSNETLAPQNLATLSLLQIKHPFPKRNMELPEPPRRKTDLVVSKKDVVRTIGSFPNCSEAGIDGILPQHVKDEQTKRN